MKKYFLLLSTLFFVVTSAHASMSYTCYRYVDGQPTGGFVKISANNNKEAHAKGIAKYKELGYKFDDVKCK